MRLRAIGQREEGRPQAGLRPARQGGKNDANDAAAICEAASRPQMQFVPIKTIQQQSMLCIHRLREGCKQERNACTNRIHGLLGLEATRHGLRMKPYAKGLCDLEHGSKAGISFGAESAVEAFAAEASVFGYLRHTFG